MREILFRGKRKDTGEWIYGVPIKTHIGVFINYDENPHYCSQYGYMEIDKIAMIDEKSVCQYTGLTNKNGRKIFEGDIFQASDGDYIQRYVIIWNEDSLEWSAECMGDPEGTLPLSEFKVEEIEVIGNIFDNPELLHMQ